LGFSESGNQRPVQINNVLSGTTLNFNMTAAKFNTLDAKWAIVSPWTRCNIDATSKTMKQFSGFTNLMEVQSCSQ
jgi:hypothetical protein